MGWAVRRVLAVAGIVWFVTWASQAHGQTKYLIVQKVTAPVVGGIYYLDGINGNDASAGTAWGTAKKTWTGINELTLTDATIHMRNMTAAISNADWPSDCNFYTTDVNQFGCVGLTLKAEKQCGQFCNRDIWVLEPADVNGTIPAADYSGGIYRHGAMWNPTGNATTQGFYSGGNFEYSHAQNVAWDINDANCYSIASEGSFVKTKYYVGHPSNAVILDDCVVTFLASKPTPGKFRPPYIGTDKTLNWAETDINYAALASVAASGTPPTQSQSEAIIAEPWLDFGINYKIQGGSVREFHAPNAIGNSDFWADPLTDGYAAYIAERIGVAAMTVHLNWTTAQKRLSVIHLCQLGIDNYGFLYNNGRLSLDPAGGQCTGRKFPIVFAACVLDSSVLKAMLAKSGDYLYEGGKKPSDPPSDHYWFGEDDQIFHVWSDVIWSTPLVRGNDNSYAAYYFWGHGTRSDLGLFPHNGDQTDATADQTGMVAWAIEAPYGPTNYMPERVGGLSWDTDYRHINGRCLDGVLLSARMLSYGNSDAGKTLWHSDKTFDYHDEYWALTDTGAWYADADQHTSDAWVHAMYDTYRGSYGTVHHDWDTFNWVPPVAVGTVTATPHSTSVDLSWARPAAAEDGEQPCAYMVYRFPGANTDIYPDLTAGTLVDANVPDSSGGTKTATGLSPSTSYRFIVIALDHADLWSLGYGDVTVSTTAP